MQKIRRFTRILKMREELRDVERARLGMQQLREEEILHHIDDLGVEKQGALNDFTSASAGAAMTCRDMWYCRQVVDVVDKKLAAENVVLGKVRKLIVDTEKRLLERHRDVQVMDKYVDKLTRDWHDLMLHTEQDEIDDLANVRFESKTEE